MLLSDALRIGVAATVTAMALTMVLAIAVPQSSSAQSPTPPPASTPAPAAAPDAPEQGAPDQPGGLFGEDTTLTAKPIVYLKGTGSWDDAFETIANALKKLKAYTDKEGLKVDGLPMTIFTSTDDSGFDYEAALPLAAPPSNPPHGDIAVGQSPAGHALKFVHNGSYDDLDNTYEAITNYLDEKRLDAQDMFIEEYVTNPATSNQDKLTVNVYVLIK